MNTTTNTRGVGEAMVAELIAAGDFLAMNGTDGMVRRWERAKAALSAEPAAQGDVDFKNFHRLLCERFGYVHDPVDWKRDQLSLIEHIAHTAPPAQPAERVPGAYVMDSGFKYESVGKHIPTVLVGFAPDDFDARDRFAAMLTASPAPADGGKGVDADKCPECRGRGYYWLEGAPGRTENMISCEACKGTGAAR